MQGVYVIVPVFNEAPVLASVLSELARYLPLSQVVVVNDGSHDGSGEIAQAQGCHVVHHRRNRGLGAALQTGMALSRDLGAQVLVTFDGDGQHRASDIAALVAPVQSGAADMVIGSRFLSSQEGMPPHRRVFNQLGNLVTWLFHGAWVSDSQSGLRAFSRDAAMRMQIRANHMDVSSEFISQAHQRSLRVHEVPIVPVYTSYSLSKGQSFVGGVQTFLKIALRKWM